MPLTDCVLIPNQLSVKCNYLTNQQNLYTFKSVQYSQSTMLPQYTMKKLLQRTGPSCSKHR